MVQILYRPPRPRSMDSISRTLRWSGLALIQHSLSDSIVYTKDMEDSFSGPFWMTKKSKWVLYLASKGRLLAYNDNERMVILHFLLQYIFISIIAIGQSNDIIVVDISAHGIYKTDKTRNTVKVAGREIGLVDGFGTCSKCDSPHVNIFMGSIRIFYASDKRHKNIRSLTPDMWEVNTACGNGVCHAEPGFVCSIGSDVEMDGPKCMALHDTRSFVFADSMTYCAAIGHDRQCYQWFGANPALYPTQLFQLLLTKKKDL